VHNLSTIIYQP